MKYIEFDESRPMDLVLLGRVAIDFNPAYNDQFIAVQPQYHILMMNLMLLVNVLHGMKKQARPTLYRAT